MVLIQTWDNYKATFCRQSNVTISKFAMPTLKNHPPINGSCTLVGAGPGDPELLTVKAVKAIQNASVLFVDDLVSAEIVAFARPGARIVYVGKRGGCKSTPQAFIEKLMLMAVREGDDVVRLKGGDPFIFGRGGEEVEHLREAGVEVTVINGITAGLAAVTSLGVPLTHRLHAHGVVFVTGHPKPGEAGTDFAALALAAAQARLTLVIYMGVAGSQKIQDALLKGQELAPALTRVNVVIRVRVNMDFVCRRRHASGAPIASGRRRKCHPLRAGNLIKQVKNGEFDVIIHSCNSFHKFSHL